MNREYLEQCMASLCIEYQHYTHPPLNDCKQADLLNLNRSGTRLKNLFLRDNYGRRHFLLLVSPEKSVNLKVLSQDLSVSRLGFASEDRLKRYLGVNPGHVSLLALINDQRNEVELLVDQEVWEENAFQCHPLVNTETYVLDKTDVLNFLGLTGHKPLAISVPEKSNP